MTPPPPRPSTVNSLLCTYLPSAATYPVDELLFEYEAAGLMELFSNQVEVESTSIQSGTVRVFFVVYGSRESCDLLISLVEQQDDSVLHTYFGTRNCVVEYFASAAPDATPPPSHSSTHSITPSPEPSPAQVQDSTSASGTSGSSDSTLSISSPGDSSASPDHSSQNGDDTWFVLVAIAGAVSSGTAAAVLLALLVLVAVAVLLMRRKEQQPYEGVSANFGEESRLEHEDEDAML